jgi:hypothetical protein
MTRRIWIPGRIPCWMPRRMQAGSAVTLSAGGAAGAGGRRSVSASRGVPTERERISTDLHGDGRIRLAREATTHTSGIDSRPALNIGGAAERSRPRTPDQLKLWLQYRAFLRWHRLRSVPVPLDATRNPVLIPTMRARSRSRFGAARRQPQRRSLEGHWETDTPRSRSALTSEAVPIAVSTAAQSSKNDGVVTGIQRTWPLERDPLTPRPLAPWTRCGRPASSP